MKKFSLFLLLASLVTTLGFAQQQLPCKIAVDEVDPFDSIRTVASEVIGLGYRIASQYETLDGPKMIPEAEAVVLYSEVDSISGFFLNLLLPEYKLQPAKQGFHVKLLLADSTVIGLYSFPDEGTFDRSTNMRMYQHTAAIPLDYYYRIVYHEIMMIRVEYERKNRTLTLNARQRQALQRALQCVGEKVDQYPIKP